MTRAKPVIFSEPIGLRLCGIADEPNIVKNLTVFPENMKRNMDATFGLIYSQHVMLMLIEKGMTREAAYDLVQPLTAKSWDEQVMFRPLLEENEQLHIFWENSQIFNDIPKTIQHIIQ